MRVLRGMVFAAGPLTLIALMCGFGSAGKRSLPESVIVTAAPAYEPLASLHGQERFPRGARLLLLQGGAEKVLLPDFAASADASLSFDGKTVLFAGKKRTDEPWAIWELTLANGSVRKVLGGESDVIRPLYLPGGRLVYARRSGQGFQLEAAQLDGTGVLPLSYAQSNAIPEDVLADGRVLFEAGFPLGTDQTPEMFLVYSDGSGVESYRCDHGAPRWGGRQVTSGDVVFTRGEGLGRFTSPLPIAARVAAPQGDYAGGVVELPSGEWLLSVRTAPGGHYAVRAWRSGSVSMQPVMEKGSEDLVEPVLVAERNRPRKHPSALHDWDYANLLALDVRQSRDGDLGSAPPTVRMETRDRDGAVRTLGIAPVEADGSFFVQVPADQPIRFALLDAQGAVVRQEQGWFWARKGEQRICVGCHAGPERAAENRVPAVLLRTTTPVNLTGTTRAAVPGGR